MKCLEYRDLAELLRDGALAAAAADEARRHADGCDACRSFEEECAVLLAPLGGLPSGPFLPEGPGTPGLPPWTAGPGGALLALLAAVGISAAAAVSNLGSGSGIGEVDEWWIAGIAVEVPAEIAAAPNAAPRGEEAASSAVAPMGDGVLSGRIVGADGAPIRDVRVSLPGGPSASTDAAGLFTLRGLPTPGSSRLRLEAPGLAAEEFLGPFLDLGAPVLLEEMAVASPVPVELRVLTPDALPAAGARVRGCRSPFEFQREERTLVERGAGCEGMPAAVEATAGPDGIARFPALARGTWSFVAEQRPFARSRPVVVRAGALRGPAREPLLLETAATLEGIVVDDETGEPLPGAEVLWVRTLDQAHSEDPRYHGRALAGPGGRFRFEAVPAVPLRVRAARPGVDLLVVAATVDAGRLPRVDIRLPRVGTLRGRCVEDSTGAPAADVVLEVAVTCGSFIRTSTDIVHVRSGPDGRFEVAGIPVSAAARVQPAFGGPWTTATPRDIRDPGTSRDVTLRVQRAGTVRGTARDPAGAPAAGVELRAFARTLPGGLESRYPQLVAATRAGPDGDFTLENVPAAVVLVVAGRPGALHRQDPVRTELYSRLADPEPQAGRVEVAPGAVVPLDLVVPPPEPGAAEAAAPPRRTLRGRVVDEEGAPVKGARLYVDPGNWTVYFTGPVTAFLRMPTGTPVPVAADGAFAAELPPLPSTVAAGAYLYTVRAFAPGRPIACVTVTVPSEGASEDLRIVMAPGAALEGTLLFEDGRPAAEVVIEAVAQRSVFSSGVEALLPQTATGPDGSFRIDGLAAEPHALLVLRPGVPVRVVRDLDPGDGPREIRLPTPFDIRGSVRGPDGIAVPGTFVLWEPEDRSEAPARVRAGEDGAFALFGVSRVRYRLRIGSSSTLEDPGEFAQSATPLLDPGDEPRVIVLERGLSVDGVVEDPTGAPSAATHVIAGFEREGVRFTRFTQSGPDGSYRLTGLPPGRLVLRAAGRALAGEVETEAGSSGVRIRLREATGAAGKDSFLAGRALDAAGRPLNRAVVHLLGPTGDGDLLGSFETVTDGRFALPANAGVRYTLTVAAPGGATAWLDGVQGGAKDLVLRVGAEPAGSLRGRALDGSGNPAAGVPVHAFRIPAETAQRGTCRFDSGWPSPSTMARSTVTGPDGAFDLGSPPGRWSVLAGSPGRGPAPVAAVTWDAAEPRALEVGTTAGRTLRATVSLGDTPPSVVEVRLESLLPAPAPVVSIRVRPGPDGTIEVPGLPAGPAVVVLFDAKGKESGRATVEPGELGAEPLEIRTTR